MSINGELKISKFLKHFKISRTFQKFEQNLIIFKKISKILTKFLKFLEI